VLGVAVVIGIYVVQHLSTGGTNPTTVATNLPAGYPASLPAGQYDLQVCTSGAPACIDSGTFPLSASDFSQFVQAIPGAADAAQSACPQCTIQVSAWDGSQFLITVSEPSVPSAGYSRLYVRKVG
jgi:hypothetical protein